MKEDLLLLCMAYPEISKKYGASVCMAGATREGELRRIYPIPFEKFLRFGLRNRPRFEKPRHRGANAHGFSVSIGLLGIYISIPAQGSYSLERTL